MNTEKFPLLIQKIYLIVDELEDMFPGRHFTPDGHMVGSIGECLAAYYYGLDLLTASTEGKDARKNGKNIEIKATQGKSVAIRSEPEHLLVLAIEKTGDFTEIYNGSGYRVWNLVKNKPRPKNGQYQVRLHRLTQLMKDVPESERIKREKS